MVGWWVILSPQSPEARERDSERNAKVFATWETGVQGLRWLYDMVENGKAQEYALRGGYPDQYTARADDLLPLFADGPPFSPGIDVDAWDEVKNQPRLVPGSRNWNITLHPDRIATCQPEQLLTLEVWDQS